MRRCTGDGEVSTADLLQLLSVWGPCPGCTSDLDDNGEVVLDLLLVLGEWRTCD